ncbi:MAG: 1-(5-phosphoribosyl)-5-[(5-phosphoribosylamino)methylideneamino]imidazole-4-carboxamide isomerase [Pseudomonadota bacterium]
MTAERAPSAVSQKPPSPAGFEVYPAIDLKGGRCVRLLHGRMDAATVYNDDPAAQALDFRSAGFENLHIVDLDGAFSGKSENAAAVASILAATDARCQVGGGVRRMADVDAWMENGVSRVILGTAAVKDPGFVREAARAYPNAIIVGVDAADGVVKTDGWASGDGFQALEIAKRYEDDGVAAIIYTDIGRDGALTGPNVSATAALAQDLAIPVIASGGVASADDVAALAKEPAIAGVVIGRALYDGRITPEAALRAGRR